VSVYNHEKMRPLSWKDSTATSGDGRDFATPRAKTLTDRCWDALADGPMTPEEVTALLSKDGERVLLTTIRARICGLHRGGRVVDSGLRGLGESGKVRVVKWRRTTPDEYRAWLDQQAANDGEAQHGR